MNLKKHAKPIWLKVIPSSGYATTVENSYALNATLVTTNDAMLT
jgi:hypothetical protein